MDAAWVTVIITKYTVKFVMGGSPGLPVRPVKGGLEAM
jgi:hypothetical protein